MRFSLVVAPNFGYISPPLIKKEEQNFPKARGKRKRKDHTTLPNRQITYLPQIPRIDITPRIPLPRCRIFNERREIPRILMRLYHITDPQRIDITLEASRKSACGFLATYFRKRIPIYSKSQRSTLRSLFASLPSEKEMKEERGKEEGRCAYESSGSTSYSSSSGKE